MTASSYQWLRRSFVLLMVVCSAWFFLGYGRKATTFYGDDIGYYIYLPSAFIYHNLDSVNKVPEDPTFPYSVQWAYRTMADNKDEITPTGHFLEQYTYGVALTELPFFLAAHAYQKLTGGKANGYAPPYIFAVKLSSMAYMLLGLWLICLVLRRYFGKTISLAAVTGIFLGTNLFWFSLHQAGMAHVPLFFLYALLMYLSMRVQEMPQLRFFVMIAFVAGLITLIRPTDVMCLLIPLLYGVKDRLTFNERILFLKRHAGKAALMIPVFILPIIPQMLYWKALAGRYIYYSYGTQQFFWRHPKIIAGLFYYKNGWLAYSPLMILSVIGLLFYRRWRPWALCVWLLIPLYIYIIYSWYCYTYINGLGSRPMIHVYPLLALPLAGLIAVVIKRGAFIKVSFAVGCALLIAINISYSVQQSLGLPSSENSNIAYNFGILFRTHITHDDLVLHDTHIFQPDTGRLRNVRTLGYRDFDVPNLPAHIADTFTGKGFLYYMKDEQEMKEPVCVLYDKALSGDARWLKCSGRYMFTGWPGYNNHAMQLRFKRGPELMREKHCLINNKIALPLPAQDTGENRIRLTRFKDHQWGQVYFFVNIPKYLRTGDSIIPTICNRDRQELFADDLKLELYQ